MESSTIRQIGSPKLHQVLPHFDWHAPNYQKLLNDILSIMRHALYHTGGIGIASNQCYSIENPTQVIIVGNNELGKSSHRYPNQQIPRERVMINPKQLRVYGPPYYPEDGEGCLSVRGCLRGKTKRYPHVDITYLDPSKNLHQITLTNLEAHIFQHEYDHLKGIVYLEKIFNRLKAHQSKECLAILTSIINNNAASQNCAFDDTPCLAFDADDQDIYVTAQLETVLCRLELETLKGMAERLETARRRD